MIRSRARRCSATLLRILAILVVVSALGIVSGRLVLGQTLRPTARIAYVHGGNIWVLDEPSDRRTRLTGDGRDSAPQWIANGQALLSYRSTRSGGSTIWRWQAGKGSRRLQDGLWSPDGAAVAITRVTRGAGSPTTVWIARQGKMRRITPIQTPFHWYPLAWSPDGARLALSRIGIPPPFTPGGRQGVPPIPGSLWVTVGSLASAHLQRLPLPPTWQRQPGWPDVAFWSPDGRFLTVGVGPNIPCDSCRVDGHPYYAVPIAGGKVVSLGTALDAEAISWASNGSLVVLSSPAGRITYDDKHLVRVDPVGRARRTLTNSAQWADIEPAVSPNGNQIAFDRGRAARRFPHLMPVQLIASRHVFLLNAEGTQLHQLTGATGRTDATPLWFPDGQWALFVRWRPQGKATEAMLWAIRADGSDAQRLAVLSPAGGFQDGFGYYGTFGWQGLFDVAP